MTLYFTAPADKELSSDSNGEVLPDSHVTVNYPTFDDDLSDEDLSETDDEEEEFDFKVMTQVTRV